MMQCMEAGGMTCVYADVTEEMPDTRGLHELSQEQRREFYANPASFSGKCVKRLCTYGYVQLPRWEGKYKVILMLRDPQEILESYEKLHGKSMFYESETETVPFTPALYDHIIRSTLDDAGKRGDIDFLILQGKAIIQEPLKRFQTIAEYWPIDPEKAAAIVDPERVTCGAT